MLLFRGTAGRDARALTTLVMPSRSYASLLARCLLGSVVSSRGFSRLFPQTLPASRYRPRGDGPDGFSVHLMTFGGLGQCGEVWQLFRGWSSGSRCWDYSLELSAVHCGLDGRSTVQVSDCRRRTFGALIGQLLLWKGTSWQRSSHLRHLEQVSHLQSFTTSAR